MYSKEDESMDKDKDKDGRIRYDWCSAPVGPIMAPVTFPNDTRGSKGRAPQQYAEPSDYATCI